MATRADYDEKIRALAQEIAMQWYLRARLRELPALATCVICGGHMRRRTETFCTICPDCTLWAGVGEGLQAAVRALRGDRDV